MAASNEPPANKRQAQESALTQPQFGTTGGDPVPSQTGSAGSDSGGAQYGTADSAGEAPQTGGATKVGGDMKRGPKNLPNAGHGSAANGNSGVCGGRARN